MTPPKRTLPAGTRFAPVALSGPPPATVVITPSVLTRRTRSWSPMYRLPSVPSDSDCVLAKFAAVAGPPSPLSSLNGLPPATVVTVPSGSSRRTREKRPSSPK